MGELLYGDIQTGGETALETDRRLHFWTELEETRQDPNMRP